MVLPAEGLALIALPRALAHPARLVPLGFLAAIAAGTAALMLPAARAGEGGAPFVTALFTATSAVSVTGLAVVDTASYWSPLGRVIILVLIQIGGFGIMSGATLLGLLVARRLGLGARLRAQAESRSLELGDVVAVLRFVLATTLLVEAAVTLLLAARLHWGHGLAPADALWHGLFHAVSSFNNAGFSSWGDNLMGFARDPALLGLVAASAVIGGLGFPVLADLWRQPRAAARWTLHTKLTLAGTALLLGLGMLATLVYEWSNPRTLGALGVADALTNAAFHSAVLRTSGFNALDTGALHDETLAVSGALMLIGGGSGGTSGGIRVTTFLVLGLVVLAVARGAPDATAFGRRIPPQAEREAMAVVLLAIGLVACGTLLMLSLTDLPLRDAAFETVSAVATVGLSTGVTGSLPDSAQLVLVALMFTGRVGSITIAAALALRSRQDPFRYPEERPIIG